MPAKVNLINRQFGLLKVIRESNRRSPSGSVYWECLCECGRTASITSSALKNDGVSQCSWRGHHRVLNRDDEDGVMSLRGRGFTANEIAAKYGVSPSAVRMSFKRRGSEANVSPEVDFAKRSRVRRTYAVDESAFSQITPESAYWIGFLMADGCVYFRSKMGAIVTLTLAETDGGHVEKFRAFLGADHPIATLLPPKYKSSAKRFTVTSRRLATDLVSYGVTPRKTHTATVCAALSLDRHFWRGVIDGDGSLGQQRTSKRVRRMYPTLKLVGAQSLTEQFADFVRHVCPAWAGKVHRHKRIYAVTLGGSSAITMIRALYHDAPVSLQRKAETATRLLNTYAVTRRYARYDSTPLLSAQDTL